MSKLRIFIENRELDTLDSVTVPITKQYEEIDDPTVICNDYSKTVTIPLSPNNNEIFNYAYNPDRVIIASDGPFVGLEFDPYKKLDCRVQWGDAIVLQGYAKMLQVTKDGYEVTINGELGKIFNELKKITFNKADYDNEEDINKYWIDGSKYVKETLNKELVYYCWNNNRSGNDYKKTDRNYRVSNIIGFLPNNSYNDNFDYNTYQKVDGTVTTFEDTLEANNFESTTGYTIESAIGDGLLPVQQNTFRSYEQIPFIYWARFVDIFNDKCKELTGYTFNWPDIDNDIAVVCKQRDEIIEDSLSTTDDTLQMRIQTNMTYPSIPNTLYIIMSGKDIKNNALTLSNKLFTFSHKPTLHFAANRPTGEYTVTGIGIGVNNIIKYEFMQDNIVLGTMIFYNSSIKSYNLNKLKKKYPNAQFQAISNISVTTQSAGYEFSWKSTENMVCTTPIINGSSKFYVKITYLNTTTTTPPKGHIITFYSKTGSRYAATRVAYIDQNINIESNTTTNTLFRSNSIITLNDFCDLKFDDIIKYCKLHRISIDVDYVQKQINFRKDRFLNYTITDYTDKVDKSNDFTVKPIAFEHHRLLFNYEESESSLNNTYNNNYGFTYGTKSIITNYDFDDEDQKLFEGLTTTIPYSPSLRQWFYNLNQNKVKVKLFKNTFIQCADNDNNYVSQKGAFFYPERQKSDLALPVRIDDDTTSQLSSDKFYTTWKNYISSNFITGVSVIKNNKSCLINTPKEVYTYSSNMFDNIKSIYDIYWDTYIKERYNKQNKLVTCYVKLSPMDFISFDFNKFWKIGNQIYAVNKIYDYDITSDGLTKVDLITIQDPTAYTIPFLDVYNPENERLTIWEHQAGTTDTWMLKTSSDWSWHTFEYDEDHTMQGFKINGTRTQGETLIYGGTKGESILKIDTSEMRSGNGGYVEFINNNGETQKITIFIE